MTDFIKEQQKLAMEILHSELEVDVREYTPDQGMPPIIYELNDAQLDYFVSRLLTNIGKELLRRIEETDNTFSFTDSRYIKKDTMKQHITNVTGAYE